MKAFSKMAILFCAMLLTSVFPVFAAELPEVPAVAAGFELVFQNERLSLHLRKDTAEIAVLDKKNNTVWYSNPTERAADKSAVGINLMNLSSQLIVKYTDETNQQFVVNNFTGSIVKKTFEITKLATGVKITFDFAREAESFKIPVTYTLSENAFQASVVTGEIEEYGAARIVEISFLPSFGAGGINDTGYLFVPDGSGAVINFNNGKQKYTQYEGDVYGADPILTKPFDKVTAKDIRLPVFGMSKNRSGFLAVIEDGDAVANISASVGGVTDRFNKVNAGFYYRIRDYATLASTSTQAKDVTLVGKSSISVKECKVSYLFLDNDKNTYSDMAAAYRDYLKEKELLPQDNSPGYSLVTQYYGGAKRKKSFFGIPLMMFESLTSYQQVQLNTKRFLESGVDSITVSLKGWTKGGLDGKIDSKISFESSLGGKKEFLKLNVYLTQKNIGFYPSADLTSLYQSGNGFTRMFDGSKNILKSPMLQYSYYLSNQTKKNAGVYSLLQPDKVVKAAGSLSQSVQKSGFSSLLSDTVGSVLYSDMKSNKLYDRQQGLQSQQKALEALKAKKAFNSPNVYALKYASFVFNTPDGSSFYDVEDYSVPFYQMVLHGSVSYTLEPSNLNKDDPDYALRLLEYGACPLYELTEKGTEDFKNTKYSYLYSTEIKNNFKEAVNTYKTFAEVSKLTAAHKMISHEYVTDTLVKTVYENNIRILINYSDHDTEYQGIKVPAKNFSYSEVTNNEA